MFKGKVWIIIYSIIGIISFIIFAWDIENDRDFYTWLWLLNSIINFIFCIDSIIEYRVNNKK
jgi:tryptophan-rich sensory protein